MSKKIVIVGGVAGGASAAARLRRLNEENQIVMFDRGEYISFANCGLPYYIGDVIQDRQKLLVQTVEGMNKRFQLDIRNLTEVMKINRAEKTVTVKHVQTGETYDESYDVLVLSPGAKPIRPNIPGIEEAEDIFTLRNIPDTDKIRSYVDDKAPKHATVIGGGFIGIEMAENLRERGVDVTLVEMADQVMTPLDREMVAPIHEHMRLHGVDLQLSDGVSSFSDQGKKIHLTSGRVIETDMVVMSIGVIPESTIAREAGLETGTRGAIRVNEKMLTSDPNIYAIGDAVEVLDYIFKEPTVVPLAWPANRQGRLVADIINGRDVKYNGTMGTGIAKVFDMTVASTGWNEKRLKAAGKEFEAVHVHPGSHAGYYPGSTPVSLKLLFHPTTGEIYGAQGVGMNGVDKRIDVIATAIKGGLTVLDLPDLELSYAPPFSSAKDPVNMIGYVASNVILGDNEVVHWDEIDALVENGATLLDVRDESEHELGKIPGSINIPLNSLRDNLDSYSKDETIYVTCQVGLRGYLASRILRQNGFKVKNLSGGYKTWSQVRRDFDALETVKTADETAATATKEAPPAMTNEPVGEPIFLDTCGLQCPGPILEVNKKVAELGEGETLRVLASDPGFFADIEAWAKKTGNKLVSKQFVNGRVEAILQKGNGPAAAQAGAPAGDGASMVVFSGDLDRALASFIIAQGAAAMGKEVTMFFTFWGLNVIRKPDAPDVKKQGLEKMFGMMMPSHAGELPLSNMNFGGVGQKMMKKVMSDKNVPSLDQMIKSAQEAGVKMVACTMSMDVMGIKEEELIDGINLGGVAAYLGAAEGGNLNLFI
ncbi:MULTISPECIES: CoA-disulfide reductase [unclassified Exiguobacterium]|uniref:CoA-disulfide reductase n=1 Tax=unclassified Exiguobacterium TaxID=2644629 RepID=UPI0010390867|nr:MULTISPECIES: CoA-disulfide reductase [unclassified Exiguobacterium]TCI34622.1 CoA-disulfide reductase [Exiguobacterium sp. SH4S7]TCI44375.1 CoA-disulfide reductase [Exiguobacterium sp. SH5S32]TCI50639.1 CoA-disulfide reductase [Exiguobacterium sp. SH1S4]TCI60696.1 CoA-disulfide reductase [Exiguobacterium sp. SH0S2]TCI69599.1 CoA-disulfide reductase [Exiguobacterium sp. SH1S1]